MGTLLNRSTAREDERSIKVKRHKLGRDRRSREDASSTGDIFPTHNGIDHENEDGFFSNNYESWENKMDQQRMMYTNDPPGAPNMYSSDLPFMHNDMMTASWSPHFDSSQLYHSSNARQPTQQNYHVSHHPNQYNLAQNYNTMSNASPKVVRDEPLPKKVQFSSLHQQQTPTLKPLTSTQSWHESKIATHESIPSKPARLSARSSAPRSTEQDVKASSPHISAPPKPIYVVLDHSATKAERDQATLTKRQRKNPERNHLDEVKPTSSIPQIRVHSHNQASSQRRTDSPTSNNVAKPIRSLVPLQTSVSTSHRSTRQTDSMHHRVQHNEHTPMMTNGIKPLKSNRQQQPLVTNEIKQLRSVENYRPHRRHHRQQTAVPLDESPLMTETPIRRMEIRHPRAQMTRIHLPQDSQRQPVVSSTTVTRSRI